MPKPSSVAVPSDAPWVKNYQPGVPATITVPEESLVEMFERSCHQAGGKTATEFFGRRTSYREIADQVQRAAEGLRRLGVQKGDRVALLLPNCPQHLVAFYAALRLGAIVVEHNPLYTAPELEEMFSDHGARVAIALDSVVDKLQLQADHIRPRTIVTVNMLKQFPRSKQLLLRLPVPKLRKLRAALTSGTKASLSWEQLLADKPLPRSTPRPGRDDLAVIQYTSGTTGQAKGAMLTHANLYANALQGAAWMHGARTGKEVSYAMLPMFHAFGMTLYLTFGVYKQAHQVLFPRPDVEMIVEQIRKRPPSVFCAVPLIYQRTAELATRKHISLRSAKYCISGAVTLKDEVVEAWEALSGGLLVEGYGLTEASPVALGNPFFPTRRTGTIGVPFPSTLMKVTRTDDPEVEVEPGQPGELLLKGPQIFQGYWKNAEATHEVLTHDGWLRTGDVVTVDADGFTTIVDRIKEIIITGGFNVSPSEVEDVLRRYEGIAEVSVVGLLNAERGDEEVIAAVVPVEGATIDQEELRTWAKERLTAYKVPRRVVILPDMPRSIIGKVLRGEVRKQVAEKLQG